MGGTPRACPACGSGNVAFRKKLNAYFCGDCEHSFAAEEPARSAAASLPRLFLSYARGDDEPFVRKLYEHLTARGFDVWFDRVSMPSRLLTFHQEIRDAIAGRDRLILVVGPKAVTSDYVTQEWQFAYFAANKCVNAIVRLRWAGCRGEEGGCVCADSRRPQVAACGGFQGRRPV